MYKTGLTKDLYRIYGLFFFLIYSTFDFFLVLMIDLMILWAVQVAATAWYFFRLLESVGEFFRRSHNLMVIFVNYRKWQAG